jgi:hypothetical protein
MQYLKAHWTHNFANEPVWLYSELDDDRWEVRKIEVFPDGSVGFAAPGESSGGTRLGESPIPPLEEINRDGEFVAEVIDRAQFEDQWSRRHLRKPPPAGAEARR